MKKLMVYGIPNCDTIKKTKDWLEAKGIVYGFHDYKQSGITEAKLSAWCREAGWEKLLNKKSTTWRGLPEAIQHKTDNEAAAIALMREHTSLIKRPVIEAGKKISVGFNETEINKLLKNNQQ